MSINSLSVSDSIIINPQQNSFDRSINDSQSLKKPSGKASTNDIFLTHKLKTDRSTHSIQNDSRILKKSQVQPKITIITRNVQPLDQFKNDENFNLKKKVQEKQKAENSKKKYFEHKIDEMSYNLKSAYLKKYKLSKSVRLKIQNEDVSSSHKQDQSKQSKPRYKDSYSIPFNVQRKKPHVFSASINLETIYHDKSNKIAPQNIQKYHNNFQLLKCAFEKNTQQKMNRIFQKQRQLQEERNLINEEIIAKLKKKAHSMRTRKIQQSSYKLQPYLLQNESKVQKISLPKLSGHFLISYSEANVNLNQNKIKIESQKEVNTSSSREKQNILSYKNVHMKRKRFITVL